MSASLPSLRKRSILVVSHSAQLAGAERSLLETIDALRTRHDVHVLLPWDGPLRPHIAERSVPFSIVRHDSAFQPARGPRPIAWRRASYLLRYAPFLRHVARGRFDAVLTNTVVAAYGPWAARHLDLPHVWHLRETLREDWLGWPLLGRAAIRRTLSLPGQVLLANSEFVRAHYRSAFGLQSTVVDQATVVPGLDRVPPLTWHPGDRERARIVVVGRLMDVKGQEVLIRAVGGLPAHLRGRVSVTFVGSGERSYLSHLESIVASLGLEATVAFAGFSPAPWDEMVRAHVVVVPSSEEPFGRVTVEAMKIGVPVIGADSGGTTELLGDGHRGTGFREGDVAQLSGVLARFLVDPRPFQDGAARARIWARNRFNEAAYASAMLEALDRASFMRARRR